MSTTATVAITLAGSTVVTGLVTWWTGRRGQEASTASVITDAARSLVEPMKAEIERLERQSEKLTVRVEVLLRRVDALLRETEECHRDRDADRRRLRTVELELARYKTDNPTAGFGDDEHG